MAWHQALIVAYTDREHRHVHCDRLPGRSALEHTASGGLRLLRDWLVGCLLDDATLTEYLAARSEAGDSPTGGLTGGSLFQRLDTRLGRVSPPR